jgi:cytochrome oxidase assembly protein ShyY1
VVDRFRFVLRPKWIFGHILVVALLATFIWCGFWQLRRLDQRKAFNRLAKANEDLPVATIDDLHIRTDQGTGHAKADQGRPLRLRGTYVADRSVVIDSQSIDSQPGVWIVTPLKTTEGPVVLVNRGFYPSNGGVDSPPASTAPPKGLVTVDGSVQPTETPGVFEHRDPATWQHLYQRIDVDRIRGALRLPTLPYWVLLTGQHPADPGLHLTPVPPPVLTNGPHLGYAIQWFGFTLVGLVGYPLLLMRKARDPDRSSRREEVIDETGGAAGDTDSGDTAAADASGGVGEELTPSS